VFPVLETLIALQALDSAADAARRRLTELPAAEHAIDKEIAAAASDVERARSSLAANQQARRELEKQVATVDARLARFEDHKAAVKTNQEYTALLHEITTFKSEKDGLEEQILGLMEVADGITVEIAQLASRQSEIQKTGEAARLALGAERGAVEAELARLARAKAETTPDLPPAVLAKYEQLLKQRKMVAVAVMRGELCTACHVRLRPAVTQVVRRNSELVNCDSCQRILYFVPDPPADAAASSVAAG
jgi:predicted  nucleic acid-binding Zn-ribbon protein